MNSFIRIEMQVGNSGLGGSFTTLASFKLDNISTPFSNIKVKIDTGCGLSVLPLDKFPVSKTLLNDLKSHDINNNVNSILSYGVESGGRKHTKPVTYDDKMACTAMKFKHNISNFELGGIKLNHDFLYINYDRSGNTLIGMDILSRMDIHISKSFKTGKTTLLACPLDKINKEYIQALIDEFDIGQRMIKELINKIDCKSLEGCEC